MSIMAPLLNLKSKLVLFSASGFPRRCFHASLQQRDTSQQYHADLLLGQNTLHCEEKVTYQELLGFIIFSDRSTSAHSSFSRRVSVFFVACTHSRISYQELSIHISQPLLLNPAGTDRLEASQAGTAHHLCESTNYSPNPTCLLLIGSKI